MRPPSLTADYLLADPSRRSLLILAAGLVASGLYLGLWQAPIERHMGEVVRILYVHVPAAWMALVAYTVTFIASIVYLVAQRPAADVVALSSADAGVLFNALALVTGSIWGRPTWGAWWAFEPRLNLAAVMLLLFLAYLSLRARLPGLRQQAAWSAVFAILAFVSVPMVWFSVKWWAGLHQEQSSPATMDAAMVLPLRVNALAFLAIYLTLMQMRAVLAHRRWLREATVPAPAEGRP